MNNSLTRFEQNGIELIIDTVTGESFASERGYARMAGKQQSTINTRVFRMSEGERKSLTKTAEIQTPGGVQGERLLSETLICRWIIKDNPDMAFKLMQLGVRVYLHKLAGYEIKSTAIAVDFQSLTLREQKLELAIKRIEGLDITLGEMTLQLSEQKQFFKSFGLAVDCLTELAKKALSKFLEIQEKFENQADPRTLLADDVLSASEKIQKQRDKERAERFKQVREQNEINKWLIK